MLIALGVGPWAILILIRNHLVAEHLVIAFPESTTFVDPRALIKSGHSHRGCRNGRDRNGRDDFRGCPSARWSWSAPNLNLRFFLRSIVIDLIRRRCDIGHLLRDFLFEESFLQLLATDEQ